MRNPQRKQAFDQFYNELYDDLRRQAPFQVSRKIIDHWMDIGDYPSPQNKLGNLIYSFSLYGFRIEFHINKGGRQDRVFTELYKHSDKWRECVGQAVDWTSVKQGNNERVSIYHNQGTRIDILTAREEDLAVLREWAVPTMIRFRHCLDTLLL